MTHGSQYQRGVCSLGRLRPMSVFKGMKLLWYMGDVTVTVQNLEVVSVIPEENVILIKGNVPGAKKSLVIIKSAVKKPNVKKEKVELVSYANETVEETAVDSNEASQETAE